MLSSLYSLQLCRECIELSMGKQRADHWKLKSCAKNIHISGRNTFFLSQTYYLCKYYLTNVAIVLLHKCVRKVLTQVDRFLNIENLEQTINCLKTTVSIPYTFSVVLNWFNIQFLSPIMAISGATNYCEPILFYFPKQHFIRGFLNIIIMLKQLKRYPFF
jgi:hypothetical protein